MADEEQQPVDDDEEALVRQVLAENPVEERGVRDEWEGKVGWHRKEDVLGLRGARKKVETPKVPQIESQKDGKIETLVEGYTNKKNEQELENPSQQLIARKGGLWVVIFVVVLLFLRFFGLRLTRKKQRRSVSVMFVVWTLLLRILVLCHPSAMAFQSATILRFHFHAT